MSDENKAQAEQTPAPQPQLREVTEAEVLLSILNANHDELVKGNQLKAELVQEQKRTNELLGQLVSLVQSNGYQGGGQGRLFGLYRSVASQALVGYNGAVKKNFFPKEPKMEAKPQPQNSKPPTPKIQREFTPEEREEIKQVKESELLDPTRRFVVIDSDSFSVLVVGLLQIKESELTTALLRRRQDYDTK